MDSDTGFDLAELRSALDERLAAAAGENVTDQQVEALVDGHAMLEKALEQLQR